VAYEFVRKRGLVTRADLEPLVPPEYVEVLRERAEMARMDPVRLGAGRLIWRLAGRGDACVAEKVGAEQTYAARGAWFPGHPWEAPPPEEAAIRLTRRYLGLHGPATPQDVAHFFGTKVSHARAWMTALAGELVEVICGERTGLAALGEDAGAMDVAPPRTLLEWPVRLLPLWDTMLMAHADKSLAVPNAADGREVWRKAAYVAATVVARGRIVATWTMKRRTKRVEVGVAPLLGWSSRLLPSVRREAKALAAHLGVLEAEVAVA
jgi:uncharacterized protein YcaQ